MTVIVEVADSASRCSAFDRDAKLRDRDRHTGTTGLMTHILQRAGTTRHQQVWVSLASEIDLANISIATLSSCTRACSMLPRQQDDAGIQENYPSRWSAQVAEGFIEQLLIHIRNAKIIQSSGFRDARRKSRLRAAIPTEYDSRGQQNDHPVTRSSQF